MKIWFNLFLVMAISNTAFAKSDKAAVQLDINKGNVSAQIDLIEEKIKTEQYEELTGLDRSKLQSEFLYIESENIDTAEALVSQSKINEILSVAFDNSKLVCKYESVIGSNMKQKQCETKLARDEKLKQTQLNQNRGLVPFGSPLEVQ